MILQSLILAIACTGAFSTGQGNYTLTYNVGRGLCTDVVLYQYDGNDYLYYSNVYFDLDNVRCTYNGGNLTGLYCDAIYFTTDEYYVDETFFQSRSFTMNELSDYNLLSGFYLDSSWSAGGGSYYLAIGLYVGDTYIKSTYISYPSQIDVIHTRTDVSFLEKNFIDYYDLYAGNNSYQSGFDRGYNQGYDEGLDTGYASGYVQGFEEGSVADSTVLSIFTGITSIAMLPLDMFMRMLNFEILGINISNIVFGFLTAYMILFVVRLFTGGNKS